MKNMLSDRDKEINSLLNFTETTRRELNKMVANFGWTEESIEKTDTTLTCPFDSSHRLYEKSVEKHIEKCLWKAEGYSEDDLPLSIPSVPPDSSTSIKLDEQLMEEILEKSNSQSTSIDTGYRLIPRTSDRLLSSFTPEERRILYDYVVANTEKLELGEDIEDINKLHKQETNGKSLTCLELIAHERNLKRRRAKHRGVHTNKKSQTEIMREVINQQMEILAEYLGEKNQRDKISLDSEYTHRKSKEREVRGSSLIEKPSARDDKDKHHSHDSRSRSHASNKHNDHFSKHHRDGNSNNHGDERRKGDDRYSRRSRSPKYSELQVKHRDNHTSRHSREKHREGSHSRRSRSPIRRRPREEDEDNYSEDRRKHKKHHKHRSRDRDEERHQKNKSKSFRRSRERNDSDYHHSKKHKKH